MKELISGLMVWSLIGLALLFSWPSFAMVMFYSIAVAGLTTLPFGLLDSWVAKSEGVDYGKARGAASLSFACFSLIVGWAVATFGSICALYILFVLVLLLLLILRNLANPDLTPANEKQTFHEATAYLSASKPFVFIIVISFLLGINQAAGNTYLPLLITSIGGTSKEIGGALFVLAASEVLVMMSFTALEKRFNVLSLLFIGFLVFFVRDSLWSFAANYRQIYLLCFLQCMSFSLVAPGTVSLLEKQLNHSYLSFALMLNQAATSIAMSIANPLYGWVAENYNIRLVFILSGAAALLAGIITVLSKKKLTNHA